MEEKKKNIKNKLYRDFLDKGEIKLIKVDHMRKVLKNIKHKHQREARALVIALYWTGARPNEVLRLKAKHITKEGNYLRIQLLASKRGLNRPFFISMKRPFITELYRYSQSQFSEKYLFYNFISKYERIRKYKSGKIVKNFEYSDKLRYHINKWFSILPETITTYYLRHNRFSQMAQDGARLEQIRQTKGSKTMDSVTPYVHMSTEEAKKIARVIK